MWKCPKCEREFETINQSHFCGEKPKTIEEYISAQKEEVRPYLNQVRDALRETLTLAEAKGRFNSHTTNHYRFP